MPTPVICIASVPSSQSERLRKQVGADSRRTLPPLDFPVLPSLGWTLRADFPAVLGWMETGTPGWARGPASRLRAAAWDCGLQPGW